MVPGASDHNRCPQQRLCTFKTSRPLLSFYLFGSIIYNMSSVENQILSLQCLFYCLLNSSLCSPGWLHHSPTSPPPHPDTHLQIGKLFSMLFAQTICYFIHLRPSYFPQHPILGTPKACFLHNDRTEFHTHTKL